MMGEAKPTWTQNRHEFLQLVNAAGAAGCRARGVAFGSACTAMRRLGWVEQIQAIGVKVRITDLGRRALQAWDAGERRDLDLRTEEERTAVTLAQILEASADYSLDERLVKALFQRMPLLTIHRLVWESMEAAGINDRGAAALAALNELECPVDGCGKMPAYVFAAAASVKGGVVSHQGGIAKPCQGDQILERGEEVLRKGDPLERFHQGGLAGKLPEGIIPRIIETGQVVPATDPRLTAAAPGASKTITLVVGQPEAKNMAFRELKRLSANVAEPVQPVEHEDPPPVEHEVRFLIDLPATKPAAGGLANLLGGADRFVPDSFASDRPAGQATPPAELPDVPADEQEDDDRRVLCPKCEGRGSTGPAHLDCTRCKTRGYVFRTVEM